MVINLELSEITDKVLSGKIKFHELDNLVGETKAREIRLKAIEKNLGVNLQGINSTILSPENCRSNIGIKSKNTILW